MCLYGYITNALATDERRIHRHNFGHSFRFPIATTTRNFQIGSREPTNRSPDLQPGFEKIIANIRQETFRAIVATGYPAYEGMRDFPADSRKL